MSIQSEITRISANVTAALAAIARKGVTVPSGSNSDDLEDLIDAISAGGGSAISIVDELDSHGGTIRHITAVDLSGDTVAADKMLANTTAHNAQGQPVTGGIQSQAAQTIHPSSNDQTIAAGKYLAGAQTIKAVTLANLLAANIKKDVVIKVGDSTDDDCVASVTGSYTGGGGSLSVDTKTVTASNYPVSISFSSMKGEPKYFFLRSTSQISSSGSTTYYYIIDMRYDGNANKYCNGNVFRIGSTRRVEVITTASSGGVVSGYTWSYSGTTLTITSSAASRSASPGAFNNTYELTYIY
ncbi:MAG: hypothetical protein IK132_12240 [Clostridia bacterium]|nr:hypothetical protein [Clostridia bacterium]